MTGNSLKKIIDVLLLLLFVCELSGFFLPNNIHIIIGNIFLFLIIAHNIVNFGFYKSLFKGKYNLKRAINTICIFLFGISLLMLAISGIEMSANIFSNNQSLSEINWRSLHLNAAIVSVVLLVIHVVVYSKRYIKGKGFYATAVFGLFAAIASVFVIPYLERWYHKVSISKDKITQGEKIELNKKILTVYFTRNGNTEFPADVDAVSGASLLREGNNLYGNSQVLAYMIQSIAGGDIEAIETEKKYLPGYMDTIKEAKKEFSESKLPDLKPNLYKPEKYDIIFVVYPLWWSTFPKAVESYLTKYDFSEKFIVPVVTHGGGDFIKSFSDFKAKIKAKYPDECLDVYSSYIPNARPKIADYIKSLKIY